MSDYPISPLEWALVKGVRAGGWRGPLLWLDRSGLALGAAFLLLVFPLLGALGVIDTATVSQFGRYCCLAVVAIGLDLVWGYAGILSLCQAMFFTLGGYALGMYLAMHGPLDGDHIPRALFVVSSAVGGMKLPWFWVPFDSLWFALLMVAVVPGLFAFAFGYMAFRSRIKGVYFSIITQALTVATWLVFCRNDLQLCGTNGLTNFTHLAGLPLSEPTTKLLLYEASALTLMATALAALWLTRTRFGRLLVAVRDSEARLRFAGYRPVWFKAAVFSIGAVLAGIGGALYAPQTGIITPANMQAAESLLVVVWVAVGGRGTVVGAVIGALGVNLLTSTLTTARTFDLEWLPHRLAWAINQVTGNLPKLWPFIMGGIFVSVVLFLPDGLVGAWRRLMSKVRGVPHEQ